MGFVQRLLGRSKLMEAIFDRDWPLVSRLVAKKPQRARVLYRVGTESGSTVVLPLHHCLMSDPPYQVVQDLIDAYPPGVVNCDSLNKRYPLHIACEGKTNFKVVRAVSNASPRSAGMVRDFWGRLPLHYAIESRASFMVIATLLDRCEWAAAQPDDLGWYPLHLACTQSNLHVIIQELIDAWPQAVMKQVNGKTPRDMVVLSNGPDRKIILRILEQEESDLYHPEAPYTMHISMANNSGRIVI